MNSRQIVGVSANRFLMFTTILMSGLQIVWLLTLVGSRSGTEGIISALSQALGSFTFTTHLVPPVAASLFIIATVVLLFSTTQFAYFWLRTALSSESILKGVSVLIVPTLIFARSSMTSSEDKYRQAAKYATRDFLIGFFLLLVVIAILAL